MSSSPLASLLIAARRNGTPLACQPELVPASTEEAYAVSAKVAASLGETIGGWKVGHMQDGRAMAAPMFASGFRTSGARWPLNLVLGLIPEVEIAVRLARDLPPRPQKVYGRSEILDSVSEVLLGLELIAWRFAPQPAAPQVAVLADDIGNCGYVTGPSAASFRDLDLTALRARLRVGGEWHDGRPHPKGDPLIPLIDWANQQCDRLGGLRAGQLVTLGSLTPLVTLNAPAEVEGEILGLGRVAVSVVG